MTDSNKLMELIKKKGYNVRKLANALGISHQALYQKINNKREFKTSEILKIQELLKLTNEERDQIFFVSNGDCEQTA